MNNNNTTKKTSPHIMNNSNATKRTKSLLPGKLSHMQALTKLIPLCGFTVLQCDLSGEHLPFAHGLFSSHFGEEQSPSRAYISQTFPWFKRFYAMVKESYHEVCTHPTCFLNFVQFLFLFFCLVFSMMNLIISHFF